MHVIITCKYEKDRMKNSPEKKWQQRFLDAQGLKTLWSGVGSGRISKSSKLLCMSSLPTSMKRIRRKTAEKKWQHRFSNYKSIGIFRRLRAANSALGGQIAANDELLRALIYAILSCKYEKDRIENSREKVATPFSPL